VRKDWSELQLVFKEKFCAGSESKRQKYYRMSQGSTYITIIAQLLDKMINATL
jgi:hypothetical protein